MEEKKEKRLLKLAMKIGKKKVSVGLITIIVLIALIFGAFVVPKLFQKPGKQNVVTVSTLEKVVKSSTLSTYETIYKGVATVMNEKRPENVDYYVTYEATVKAGLDFNKITIDKDDENSLILVRLPKIELQEPKVPIEKLEYIIVNNKMDKNGISAVAYPICIEDVRKESAHQEAIYQYAEQNAKNLIGGLLAPFIEQMDGDYEISFVD